MCQYSKRLHKIKFLRLNDILSAYRGNANIKEMTEEIEKNLENLRLDKYDKEDSKSFHGYNLVHLYRQFNLFNRVQAFDQAKR